MMEKKESNIQKNFKEGTLISYHRGMPIQKGERYALTNYYYLSEKIGGRKISDLIAELLNDKL